MPAARESLLDAARSALADRPWSAVRMVEVAASAGVSRQTLYNEFGGKDGLARALVRREADGFLAGIERTLASGGEPPDRLTATVEWTADVARGNPIVRAMLTGCWSERLPMPVLSAVPSSSTAPAQRRADGPLPSPGDFVRIVRDRVLASLTAPDTARPGGADPVRTGGTDPSRTGGADQFRPGSAELTRSCELVVRLALSCVAAPPAEGQVAELVRDALHRRPV
jgi:AcrR family transcriptional regulator